MPDASRNHEVCAMNEQPDNRLKAIANKIGTAERVASVSWHRHHENAFALHSLQFADQARLHLCDDADDDFLGIGGNVAH